MSVETWIAFFSFEALLIGALIKLYVNIGKMETKIEQLESDFKLHESLNERSIEKISCEIQGMNSKLDTIIGFLKGKDFNV